MSNNKNILLKDNNALSFDDHWSVMQPVFLKLLQQEPVSKAKWQNLFWILHKMCMWDGDCIPKLYSSLQESVLHFLHQVQSNVLVHQENQALLKAYIVEWRKFFRQCNYLLMPFGELDATLKRKNTTIKKKTKADDSAEESVVCKLMQDSWYLKIFSNIKNRLNSSAMKLVHAERNGEVFDSQLVIGVRESYVNLCSNQEDKLQMYRENFERAYLDATEEFYREKAPEYLNANGVQNYIRYADHKLKEEEQRGLKYLEACRGSIQSLNACCVKNLVTVFKEVILAKCLVMIKNNETEKLQLMFKLMNQVSDGITPMLGDFERHITDQGLADMISSADIITQDSEKYVEQLLELFTRYSKLVREAFHNDPRFLASRDKAFKELVNDTSVFRLDLPSRPKGVVNKAHPESRCPELLANYCDMLLRKTPLSKKLTSEEIEGKLKNVLLVLKYVQNKDVFMQHYKTHLTRRLILNSSADSEKEENMVEWLRMVGMPANYVNKLARMFQDVKVSKDLNQHFKDSHHKRIADVINIKILNAGAWAKGCERVLVSLPLELENFIPDVEEFYHYKHNGRKLQWHHQMSNGTIIFSNLSGKFELNVTTFQMAVLFVWNQRPHERISFENLRLATQLPDAELRRTLWSLVAFPKMRHQLLLSFPEAKSPNDFEDSTLFQVNQGFTIIKNKKSQKRGSVNLVGRLQLSTVKSKEDDNESIIQLRMLRMQEAIVKILKMRKRIAYAQLQGELVEILKNMFLPSEKMIKEQIEWLIEHKYMERDKGDIDAFVYMA